MSTLTFQDTINLGHLLWTKALIALTPYVTFGMIMSIGSYTAEWKMWTGEERRGKKSERKNGREGGGKGRREVSLPAQ